MEWSSWQLFSGKTEFLALSHIQDQPPGSPREPSSLLGELTAHALSSLCILDCLPSGTWVFVSSAPRVFEREGEI